MVMLHKLLISLQKSLHQLYISNKTEHFSYLGISLTRDIIVSLLCTITCAVAITDACIVWFLDVYVLEYSYQLIL